MPNIRVAVPSLTGGLSTQPDHQRAIDQVESLQNVVCDVARGLRKRAGCQRIERIESLEGGEPDIRMHAINRSPQERYVVLYGDGTLRVRHHDDGEACPIGYSDDAAAYLASGDPGADDIGMLSIADYTIIWNRLVPTGFESGLTYAVTGTFADYDDMVAHTPTDGTYHEAQEDTPEVNAGFYRYDVDGVTFGTFSTRVTAGNEYKPEDIWNDAGKNPGGFKIEMRKYNPGLTGGAPGTWTFSTLTLSKTGAFTQAEAGDQVKITGGTATLGWYTIASKTSNDAVVLSSAISGSNQTDIESSAVGGQFEATWNFPVNPKASMAKVAEGIQDALRSAGAPDACVAWDVTAAPQGKLTITNQWRGDDADILGLSAPSSGYDWTDTGRMFKFSDGTTASGGGGVPSSSAAMSKDVAARWTRVAESGAVNAQPDPTKMPVVMRRTRLRDGDVTTRFTVETLSWNTRTDGTQYTNPGPKGIASGEFVTDVALHRNRLVLALGQYVAFSAANDLFNFFVADATNPTDADPFELTIGQQSVAEVEFLVPFRRTLVACTRGGEQFELSTPETLTPGTAAFTATTTIETIGVRPAVMADRLYLLGASATAGDSSWATLYEYAYDDLAAAVKAESVSAHIRGLLPAQGRTLAAHDGTGSLFVLATHTDDDLMVYATYDQNRRKVQSAWSRWEFADGWSIRDVAVLDGRLYALLVDTSAGRVFLTATLLEEPTEPEGYDFYPHLDVWETLTGSHAAGTTTWTYVSARQAVDAIVLEDGTILDSDSPGWAAGTTTVAVTGNYSGQTARVGYTFPMEVKFTRPFLRDERGLSDLDDATCVLSLTAAYESSGHLVLTREFLGSPGLPERTATLDSQGPTSGRLVLWAGGDADDAGFVATSDDPRPTTITGLEWAVNVNRRNG